MATARGLPPGTSCSSVHSGVQTTYSTHGGAPVPSVPNPIAYCGSVTADLRFCNTNGRGGGVQCCTGRAGAAAPCVPHTHRNQPHTPPDRRPRTLRDGGIREGLSKNYLGIWHRGRQKRCDNVLCCIRPISVPIRPISAPTPPPPWKNLGAGGFLSVPGLKILPGGGGVGAPVGPLPGWAY